MGTQITEIKAVSLTIFDDMRNEQSLENRDAPFNLNKPKWVTKQRPIRRLPQKAIEMVTTEGEGSGHDCEIPLTPSNRPGKELPPNTDFDPEKARQEAEERNKIAINPGVDPMAGSVWKPHHIQAEMAEASSLRENLLEAATSKKTTYDKPPSVSNWPPNISAKGLAQWKTFFQKYGKLVKAESAVVKQWVIALAIWRNYSMKRRIAPFDPSAGFLNQDTQDYMIKRVKASRTDTIKLAKQAIRGLEKNDLIVKVAKEKLLGVDFEKSKKRFALTSVLPFILTKPFSSREITVALKALGFTWNNSEGSFVQGTIKGHSLFFYADQEKDTKANLAMTQYLNDTQTAYLLGIRETELKDTQSVIRKLKAYFRGVLSEMPLS